MPAADHCGLIKETRMPVHHIVSPRQMGERSTFPHPQEHISLVNGWREKHNVTVSHFNNVHHKSQREYFDRPIDCPNKGYAHVRREKMQPFQVYAAGTPMRSIKHC